MSAARAALTQSAKWYISIGSAGPPANAPPTPHIVYKHLPLNSPIRIAVCANRGAATLGAICTSPTYGNCMANYHNARDGGPRHTCRHVLGRPLNPGNSGALQ